MQRILSEQINLYDHRKESILDTTLDHLRAKELSRHRLQVADIKRRAHQWRLRDCSEETLNQMRHALIVEMESLEKRLQDADNRFLQHVENGQPLRTEKSLQTIDQLAREWERLNEHLQDVDEALLERHLHTRLVRVLGSHRRLLLLDALVFWSIILIVIVTLIELLVVVPAEITRVIVVTDTAISLFLLTDFGLRIYLSEDRAWYFRRYWIDFVASIPFQLFFISGPFVSVARFARLARLLRLGRAMRVLTFNFRGLEKLFQTLQIHLLKRALVIALVLLFIGALTIDGFEQSTEIQGIAESLWWSFVTVVTGGFADLYNPMTIYGRLLTVGLVLLGLTVTGIFTASLTSVLVEDESSRIEQKQYRLEQNLGVINQKLDLLSGETNRGLIALETVAQQLSNQRSRKGVADVLAQTMLVDFNCMQASVHLLTADGDLERVTQHGLDAAAPPPVSKPGVGFIGRIVGQMLEHPDIANTDLEPETEPRVAVDGLAMVCPLVAGRRVLGVLHVVMPEDLGRFYLYNRVPMTLAHQAAMAFYAADLENGERGAGSGERGPV